MVQKSLTKITLSLPSDLKKRMDKYTYVNWSAIARISFKAFLKVVEEQNITEEDLENNVLMQLIAILGGIR